SESPAMRCTRRSPRSSESYGGSRDAVVSGGGAPTAPEPVGPGSVNRLPDLGLDVPIGLLDRGHPGEGAAQAAALAEAPEVRALRGEEPGTEGGARPLDQMRRLPRSLGIPARGRLTQQGERRRRLVEERGDDVAQRRGPAQIVGKLLQHAA